MQAQVRSHSDNKNMELGSASWLILEVGVLQHVLSKTAVKILKTIIGFWFSCKPSFNLFVCLVLLTLIFFSPAFILSCRWRNSLELR